MTFEEGEWRMPLVCRTPEEEAEDEAHWQERRRAAGEKLEKGWPNWTVSQQYQALALYRLVFGAVPEEVRLPLLVWRDDEERVR